MTLPILQKNNLVLYKQKAARIAAISAKRITVELQDGTTNSVRPKDVALLHPGPVTSLSDLDTSPVDIGELMIAWELLGDSTTNLHELVELSYGVSTPSRAWAVWQVVADDLYFSGVPDAIDVHSAEYVQQEQTRREERAEEQEKWGQFVQRIAQGETAESDANYLREVEALALGIQDQSQVLRALGKDQSPENAHDLLLKTGYWGLSVNPYPSRAGLSLVSAQASLPELPQVPRRDLTHLLSLAIDDEGNQDPDDALSWDNGRIWVHVADVAALVKPGSQADLEARARGANLYLPEKTITMLPSQATQTLGLGLTERSPALSFGFELTAQGQIINIEIVPTWVLVTRWSYEEAQERLAEPELAKLHEMTGIYANRRKKAGAVEINLPEVRVNVIEDIVIIKPFQKLQSRDLVRDAMLMAGEAVSIFAKENNIPIPYTTQDPPSAELPEGDSMSAMFATRKLLKPGRQSGEPGPHSSLGMEQYAQVTSPLRRYLDLVIHQQLRAFLDEQPLLSQLEIVERIGAATLVQQDLRRTERLSRRHWTHVYLMQNPYWQGEGIIVEQHGRRHVTVLPDLDLETDLYLPQELPVDSSLLLKIQDVNLAFLNNRFERIAFQQNP